MYLIFLETRIIVLHFAPDKNLYRGLRKTIFPQECVSAVQGHPKSFENKMSSDMGSVPDPNRWKTTTRKH